MKGKGSHMEILVTGGAGFIGRWVVDRLLKDGHQVWVLDNLSNGRKENLETFLTNRNFMEFTVGDIQDEHLLKRLFSKHKFDLCFHLAAKINVQESIDHPQETFASDVIGTFYLLEQCKEHNVKMVFMSTCMVYDRAHDEKGINELSKVKPASVYAGTKLAAEFLVMSYYHSYGLPVVIVRPFNTYGPYQKTNTEGGVVAIFIHKKLANEPVQIYGDGTQTRDLLYVEDCARFVVAAGYSNEVNGEIINAGLGRDISINDLAKMIVKDAKMIKHVKHIHPQSEIQKLLCDNRKAKRLLNWEPLISLEEGIQKTERWIQSKESDSNGE